MLKSIISLYKRIIKNKFFNKVLIVYSIIIISTVTLLVCIISYKVTNILEEQSKNFNRQILQSVDQYFEERCKNIKNIHKYIVENERVNKMAKYLLLYDGETSSSEYIDIHKSFEKLIVDKLRIDKDISHLYLYNINTNKYSTFYNGVSLKDEFLLYENFWRNVKSNSIKGKNYKNIYINPAATVETTDKRKTQFFSMHDYIRDKNDISSVLGAIVFDYDSNSVKVAYSPYKQYLKGYMLIISDEGQVIFDSSGQYYDKPFPFINLISEKNSYTINYDSGIINVLHNTQFGFKTIGVIPYNNLYKDTKDLNNKIYLISFISIIFILLLTSLSTKIFTKRIKVITSAIRQIQNGNLKTQIIDTNSDEIAEISTNLNQMCQKLNTYIENEYISNIRTKNAELKQNESLLRQKSAELYALQSQINPHFLYNTLEVIRMKAICNDQNEIAKMIKTLASLFRNNIKTDIVIQIKDEINLCKSYLELYNIRFAGKLTVDFDVSPNILNFAIVKHLLQPIIENCLVHGIDLSQNHNVISIQGYMQDMDIFIIVSDKGIGLDSERLKDIEEKLQNPQINTTKSIGITNVNYRIKLLYGDDYGLSIKSVKGKGTQVTIKISAKTKEELITYVQGINS